MRRRAKPSKAVSFVGMIVGVFFCVIGFRYAITMVGIFGYIWTGVAVLITCLHAYNFFSKKGISIWEIVDNNSDNHSKDDFEMKLRKITKLRDDNLISEEEFKEKREEILSKKW